MSLITAFMEAGHEAAEGAGGWWDEYVHLLQDPAHILFEITLSVVFDFVIIYLGYQLFIKRVVIPRIRRELHREIDAEHHVEHHDHVDDEDCEVPVRTTVAP